jgi:hypothetical protein
MWWQSVLHDAQFIKNLPPSNKGQLEISPFNVSHSIDSTITMYIFYVVCTRHIQIAKNHSQLKIKAAVKIKTTTTTATHLSQSVFDTSAGSLYLHCMPVIFLMQAFKPLV